MSPKSRDLVNIVIAGVIAIGGFQFGSELPSVNHKDIIVVLISISAIIFGVVGAWLSITKIEIQQGIVNAEINDEADELMERARGLIKPLTISSLVLILTIMFIFIQPVIESIVLTIEYENFLKSLSFSIISVMGYSLMYCLGCIILQSAEFLLNLSQLNQSLRPKRTK